MEFARYNRLTLPILPTDWLPDQWAVLFRQVKAMARPDTFTFRINQAERGLLERLAQRLQRSQSDALRWLIREAVRELDAPAADEVRYGP